MKTFYLCEVGCPRRRLDAQKICSYLIANGISYTEYYKKADLIVIVTCAFIKSAEDISIDAIKYYVKRNKKARIIVAGCLSQINPQRLREAGEFDSISPKELDKFDKLINAKVKFTEIPEPNKIKDYPLILRKSSLAHFLKKCLPKKSITTTKKQIINRCLDADYKSDELYNLRIARGCLGNCNYCAIKFAAGKLKSKPSYEIVKEFKNGLDEGYKKFVLIAGDTGCYGLDIQTTIVDLLKDIFEIGGEYKLIIKEFNAQWLIKYFAELKDIFKKYSNKIDYIIIPVQSASNKILKSMNRPYDINEVKKYLGIIKRDVSQLRIATHIMVGFPGETHEDFKKSVDFIKEFKFPYVDIYSYEDRPRAISSNSKYKIPPEVIKERFSDLLRIQEQVLKDEADYVD